MPPSYTVPEGFGHSVHISPAQALCLHNHIYTRQDHPKKGILFRDISPLLADEMCLFTVTEGLCAPYIKAVAPPPTHVAGLESRGFIPAAAMARRLCAGMLMVRKGGDGDEPGKLPPPVDRVHYGLEYGNASFDLPVGAVPRGARVVIADDLIATAGSAIAGAELVEKQGGIVVGFAFLIELRALGGAARIKARFPNASINSLLTY